MSIEAILILLRYRLAPKYPYPAALDDCYSATKHFLENAARYETDPTRIAVAGKFKRRFCILNEKKGFFENVLHFNFVFMAVHF